MKKTIILSITVFIIMTMLFGCGTIAPAGSSAEANKKVKAPVGSITPAVVEPIEVDAAKLPEGITKDALTEKDGKFYLDQTDFKWLSSKLGKNITVAAKDGFEYTATADAKMVTKVPVTAKAKEEAAKQTNQTQNTTANTGAAQNTTTNNTGTASNSGSSGNHANTSSGSTSSSGSSGGSSGGGYVAPTQPAQPVHQHTWVPHTTTVDQGWYEDIYEYHSVCNGCGMILDGMSGDQIYDHVDNCGNGSWSSRNVVVGQQWVSNPVTVTDYYYCSGCGARQ